MEDLTAFLVHTEVFKGLGADDVQRVARICKQVHFNKGEVIVEEDARERELYVIKSGRVTISLSPPGSEETRGTLTSCTPGQVFGELSFIDGARRSTWVIALEDVEVYQIRWDSFSGIIQTKPEIGYRVMSNLARVIADRLRDTTMLCSNLLRMR
jgi:CRP/FNR family cyclic AMP-dependent transcriptional regulator